MNQERKRLSDCPVERLAQCRGEVGVLARIDSLLERRVFLTDAGVRLALAGHDSVDLVDRAYVTLLQAEVSALQQRLNIADQRASDLTWLAKSAYMEGWELGWVTRHTDANNEKRVTPWAPPREVMEREWLTSECRAALNTSAPPIDRKGQLRQG
jgi:hypothetical protein